VFESIKVAERLDVGISEDGRFFVVESTKDTEGSTYTEGFNIHVHKAWAKAFAEYVQDG